VDAINASLPLYAGGNSGQEAPNFVNVPITYIVYESIDLIYFKHLSYPERRLLAGRFRRLPQE